MGNSSIAFGDFKKSVRRKEITRKHHCRSMRKRKKRYFRFPLEMSSIYTLCATFTRNERVNFASAHICVRFYFMFISIRKHIFWWRSHYAKEAMFYCCQGKKPKSKWMQIQTIDQFLLMGRSKLIVLLQFHVIFPFPLTIISSNKKFFFWQLNPKTVL